MGISGLICFCIYLLCHLVFYLFVFVVIFAPFHIEYLFIFVFPHGFLLPYVHKRLLSVTEYFQHEIKKVEMILIK